MSITRGLRPPGPAPGCAGKAKVVAGAAAEPPEEPKCPCPLWGACSPSRGSTGNPDNPQPRLATVLGLCLPGHKAGLPLSPAVLSASFTSSEGQRGLRRISCPAGGGRAVPAAAAARRPCQGGRPGPCPHGRPRLLRAELGPGRTPPLFICKASPIPVPSGRPGQAAGRGVSGGQCGGARASARLRPFVAGASCRWVNGAEAIGEGRQKWALKEGVSAGQRDKGQNTQGRRGTDGDGRREQLGGERGVGAAPSFCG